VTDAIRKHLRDFVALVVMAAVGVGCATFILSEQRFRFPLLQEKPWQLKAEFSDAQGVMPGQGQTVRIAGMRIGDITKVQLSEGRALVTMDIEQRFRGRIRGDARALLRPRTGLKDMFIALDPGTSAARVMGHGDVIRVGNTRPDVDADEILRMLDRDSRDYLRLLINGVGKGLENRAGDLREVFRRLGPLHRDIARLQSEVAKRRVNLARLVHNYGGTVERLGEEDRDLSALVRSSQRVFGRLAQEDRQVSTAVSRLPGALRQTHATLGRVQELGEVAGPAFESLRPAVRRIPAANAAVRPLAREAAPILRERIRPFVREAQPYVRTLRPAAENLEVASPDLREAFFELNRFFNQLAYNPGGREKLTGDAAGDARRDEGLLFWLGWLSQNTTSIFSTADASGPYRRIVAMFTCSALLASVKQEPANELILGVSDVLNDPGLCPAE
jgi:phospholipid/cholesterol/gamma-HCH transport system substrate-binding protein